MNEQKPTAAAMRAATGIVRDIKGYNFIAGTTQFCIPSPEAIAERIDTETGLPELIAALSCCLTLLEDMGHGSLAGPILAKAALARYEGTKP
jgi:hypothetical protein